MPRRYTCMTDAAGPWTGTGSGYRLGDLVYKGNMGLAILSFILTLASSCPLPRPSPPPLGSLALVCHTGTRVCLFVTATQEMSSRSGLCQHVLRVALLSVLLSVRTGYRETRV